jgi:hypothetical protein
MARVNKWEVIDRIVRLVVYLIIIYFIWKLFNIPFP